MSDQSTPSFFPYLLSVEYARNATPAPQAKPVPAVVTLEATTAGLTLRDNKGNRITTAQEQPAELICGHATQPLSNPEAVAQLANDTGVALLRESGIFTQLSHVTEGLKGGIKYVHATYNLPEHAPSPIATLCKKAQSSGAIQR